MAYHLVLHSLLVGLPDSSSSLTSQHSIARISFHKDHFYPRNLNVKIGNRFKCEFFNLFLKFLQQLFATHIYLTNPFFTLSHSLLFHHPFPFLSCHQPHFSGFTSQVSVQTIPCLLSPVCDLLCSKLQSFTNAIFFGPYTPAHIMVCLYFVVSSSKNMS